MNIAIPQDLKLIGYDGTKFVQNYFPQLSTIAQPIADFADLLVDLLIQRITTPEKNWSNIMLCQSSWFRGRQRKRTTSKEVVRLRCSVYLYVSFRYVNNSGTIPTADLSSGRSSKIAGLQNFDFAHQRHKENYFAAHARLAFLLSLRYRFCHQRNS